MPTSDDYYATTAYKDAERTKETGNILGAELPNESVAASVESDLETNLTADLIAGKLSPTQVDPALVGLNRSDIAPRYNASDPL